MADAAVAASGEGGEGSSSSPPPALPPPPAIKAIDRSSVARICSGQVGWVGRLIPLPRRQPTD